MIYNCPYDGCDGDSIGVSHTYCLKCLEPVYKGKIDKSDDRVFGNVPPRKLSDDGRWYIPMTREERLKC